MKAHTPDRPAWYIHTSGTGILTWEDIRNETVGILREKEYNDWDGVDEVTSLPDDALHRNVDKIVLAAAAEASDRVKTAIVCPPTIYGPGRGSGNTRSIQAYLFATSVLKRGKGFVVGEGKNIWHQVHVQDLSDVYLALGEAAAAGGGKATWGSKDGYYFAENGTFVWGDVQRAITKAAYEKKFIPTAEIDSMSKDEAGKLHPFGPYAWGSNSRGHAIRARKLFGWNPSKPSIFDLVPDIVGVRAQDLGLAQKAETPSTEESTKKKKKNQKWDRKKKNTCKMDM
jgi:nucleoside-diphosphate-sugar epimerase